ncbi:PorP/SprF family type IX secretion system membrane protein [Mucilaginibacter phyllosphaerae]|uniref:Type IX secretion system PorP/SprF family membrane protein n=1 Tax=Mucilaginibacter phyllosphaerae TaxID=1812349 RepID=A0A4Y8AC57_9SPHI|nr:type IX secretion system membrane protein PorP/SprF [Mucilaginibacter phyllosphaerae]MBB3969056.1 type IX secretion system PorP/SprF family membrane protein [Mucilaginibacter phyllosphaerae]TEW66124.1 type IX secretion system membrane protein PorP/SprF [Mucilaginibacter phyllosphaerae]GGH05972.1 membrane protein [Mucilaginibacter phyllosphaerae]
MLKKLLLILLFFVLTITAFAQQRPQYTQYIFNNYLLNPAVAGIENYTDIKLGYRSQWTGLEGAPVTAYFSINAPLGTEFTQGDANAFPASGGASPYSRSYVQDYRAAEPHHGIGFMLVTDKAGPIDQTNMAATYAYHLGITENLNLAVGVSAGFNHLYLNTSLITLENPDDPTLRNINNNQWKPDASVGIWAYAANYYVGASVQQIIPNSQYFTTRNNLNLNKTVPHYFLTGGYKIPLSDDVTFLPSALLKFIPPAPTTFDVNMKLSFRDRFWFGGSYRKDDSFGILAGFNLNSYINVSYSYDATTSALRTVSNGSHEIVLGILLNNRYNLTCPQHSW